ncbi:MAG TPA: HD-GYP domain-containing protein [Holophaga sp.]|nr:HD-GYP domain-containing protein [Holophaga sp.]
MIKKISVQDLRIGMFIHDLNAGWMDHVFFRSRFMLRKEEDLQKIQTSGIRELYIDTVKGMDLPEAPTQTEVQEQLMQGMLRGAQRPARAQTTHREELAYAKAVRAEADHVIRGVLADARLGKQAQVEQVEPVVAEITDSILRNPGTLVSLLRLREGDNYTFTHCVSVATLLVTFGRHLGMDRSQLMELGVGGMLHDLGKMRVPDHILNKPGKLTNEEFEIMKQHVDLGMQLLRSTPGITPAMAQIAGEHHERFGGAGYPDGLHGFQISASGRMAAIVDVYDAITSNRIYHRGMEPSVALQKIFEWSEHHFDPELAQQFIQAVGIYPVGSLVRLESQRLAVVVDLGEGSLLNPVVRVVYDARRRKPLEPQDLDLSRAEHGGDHIIGHELPGDWNIDPFSFLTLDIGL